MFIVRVLHFIGMYFVNLLLIPLNPKISPFISDKSKYIKACIISLFVATILFSIITSIVTFFQPEWYGGAIKVGGVYVGTCAISMIYYLTSWRKLKRTRTIKNRKKQHPA